MTSPSSSGPSATPVRPVQTSLIDGMERTVGSNKPSCPVCGGSMTRMLAGGEEKNAAGKWVASKHESWRCDSAWNAYEAEKREFMDELHERYADHTRWVGVLRG